MSERRRDERRRPRRRPRGSALYHDVLAEVDPRVLAMAERADGLADETALVRLLLRRQLAERPEATELVIKGMHLLVRMVSAEHRLAGDEMEQFKAEARKVIAQFVRNAMGGEAADG